MSSTLTLKPAPLAFDVVGTAERLVLDDFRLVIAGYTGRDEAAVKAHIDELAAIGVPAPASVPSFYPLDRSLVTQAEAIEVRGGNTSGEVEPVLVRSRGRLYLAVGSDHTDRDIERDSVAESKAACPKPVSSSVIALADDIDWDAVAVSSTVDGGQYQMGTLRSLRIPTSVLGLYDREADDAGGDVVMFGGTLPIIGGEFVAGTSWGLSLEVPGMGAIEHSYRVTRVAG